MSKRLLKILSSKLFLFLGIFLILNFSSQWLVEMVQSRQFFVWWPTGETVDVFYLNVGQGDATLIRTPLGNNILIDGGPDLSVLYQLGQTLPWYEKRIDMIILTHPDQDHLVGLIDVIRRYQVDRVLINGISDNTPAYQFFLSLLAEQNIPVTVVWAGKSWQFGEVTVNILYPPTSLANEIMDDNNASSLVIRIDYKQSSILFTGDLPQEQELELVRAGVDLNAQVMKAGHHGSKTSSHIAFIQAVDPDLVVISVGKDNRYGHPHYRVLKNIDKVGARVLRTDSLGTIHLQLNGAGVVRP